MTNVIILFSAVLSASLSIFVLNWLADYLLKKKLAENEKPITVSLFKGTLFIAIGFLLNELILAYQTLIKVLPSMSLGTDLIIKEVSFFCIFLGVVLAIFMALFWIATLLFSLITKGERISIEVANNNLNSVIIFAGILVILILAIKTGIVPLLDELIPYPTNPNYG